MKDLKERTEISKRILLATKHERRDALNKIKKEYSKADEVFPFWVYPVAGLATVFIFVGMFVMTHLAFSPTYLVQLGLGKKAYFLLIPSILIVIFICSKLGTMLRNYLKQ